MSTESRALERCVGDIDRFFHDVWSGHAHHHPGGGAGFRDLLTLQDVDHLLSSTALRTPGFRLVKDGEPLPVSGYTKSGRIGSVSMTGIAEPPRVFQLFHDGATIVLQGMHRYWAPLARFCRDLEMALGHSCQVNAYITPPGSRGLALHHDSHDVFVLQAFGRKHWEVHEVPGPPADERAGGPEVMQVELEPGDGLYMPKGTPHAARTQEVLSGHLTVGILTTTWRVLLDSATERLQEELGLDEPLPPGFHLDPEAFTSHVGSRLTELQRGLEKLDPGEIGEGMIDRFLTSRPPLVPGGLVDSLRADALDDDSPVRRRAGSVCELRVREGRLVALLGDRELRLPLRLEAAMRAIAGRNEFVPRDLEACLDPESRLVLVRRLVREGLLEVPVAR